MTAAAPTAPAPHPAPARRPWRDRVARPSAKRFLGVTLAAVAVAPLMVLGTSGAAQAASSDACEGGGFSLVNLTSGAVVAQSTEDGIERVVPIAALGATFGVRGRYIEYNVRASDFAVLSYTFTGAANEEDMTGGRRTPVYASKVPQHRGLSLSSGVDVSLEEDELEIGRTGTRLSMKIQSKDCAQGGIFQMEPERGDGTRTRIVHTLAQPGGALNPFYFDNPRFRARVGQFLGADCTSVTSGPPSRFCVQVNTRVNIANGVSRNFVARDSAQVADRVPQPDCNTATPITPSVAHCGRVSVWDVASGGRMGFVSGEDAVEVSNPPTDCVSNCQAQNQVRGRLAVLGHPFPVPAGSRLTPPVSARPLPALTPV